MQDAVPPTPVGDPHHHLSEDDPEASELFGPDDADDEAIARGGDVDFYKVVNADEDMRKNAEDLLGDSDHEMIAMMDVLQILGVDPVDACSFTSSIVKDGSRCKRMFSKRYSSSAFIGAVTGNAPTFMEIYGRGKIVDASHNLRRNLNVNGLDALDIRTCKPNGSP